MINLITSDNIFKNKKVVLNYLVSNSGMDMEIDMEHIQWMRLELSAEDNDEQFDCFYEDFLNRLATKFKTYFFYSEGKKYLKSRTRSYTKLFYGLRNGKVIKEGEYAEKEIDFEEDRSILTGIIQTNNLDFNSISENLNLSTFRFGLGIKVTEEDSHEMDLDTLMSKIDKEFFHEDKFIRLNYLSVIRKILTPNSFLYSYLYDGKDDLIFTIYCGKKVYRQLKNIILNSLPKEGEIVERKVLSKEVDDLIELYFNDWRLIRDKK